MEEGDRSKCCFTDLGVRAHHRPVEAAGARPADGALLAHLDQSEVRTVVT